MLIIKVFGSGENKDSRIEEALYRFFCRKHLHRDKINSKTFSVDISNSLHKPPDEKKS